MIDLAIKVFLEERKELWLKNKITKEVSEEEEQLLKEEAEYNFSFDTWVTNGAKRAKQLALVSHPGKFSHPSVKATNIIAKAESSFDGLLRTGNVDCEPDVVGSAAALDVYKFLSLSLQDGRTVLQHLEDDSEYIREQFSSLPYRAISQGLLAIKEGDEKIPKTSNKVKQVYFPVSEGTYNLLSVLYPSSILFTLKKRIQDMHFSQTSKEARQDRKKNIHNSRGYSEIYNLCAIGYGGTKPQNISVLNNQNGGVAYLLSSMPPDLKGDEKRKVFPPRNSFFRDSLYTSWFIDDFRKFHRSIIVEHNNFHIRRFSKGCIQNILHKVIDRLWTIRSLPHGWSEADAYKNLPAYQKILLDEMYKQMRKEDDDWFIHTKKDLARWFDTSYTDIVGAKACNLGDELITHIESSIAEYKGGFA